jgi:NADPH-dependent 2,4-dienoyl-CoA reductase/sulfur reductase-like enzyme
MIEEKIYIIGNGVAGVNAALSLRRLSAIPICIVSDESDYFFSRTALMYVFMGQMRLKDTQPYENSFWVDNKIELKKATVSKVEPDNNKIIFSDDSFDFYAKLVIATGSIPLKLPLQNSNLKGIASFYYLNDLEKLKIQTPTIKDALIIGGGLIGIELAEMLVSKGINVVFLIREPYFWSNIISKKEGKLIEKQIIKHGVKIHFETETKAFVGNENEEIIAVETTTNERISAQYVCVTIGVKPNINFEIEGLVINRGILVDEFLETNLPNIYAAGDCAELSHAAHGRRSIEAVWYTAKAMGESLGSTLAGQKTIYKQGNWFNSAKFFDLEYQTYGIVPAVCEEFQSEFYFEKDDKMIRFVFNKISKEFLGVNTWGIRLRQDFFERILNTKKDIIFTIDKIDAAFFDPEFYPKYGKEIKETFKKDTL